MEIQSEERALWIDVDFNSRYRFRTEKFYRELPPSTSISRDSEATRRHSACPWNDELYDIR